MTRPNDLSAVPMFVQGGCRNDAVMRGKYLVASGTVITTAVDTIIVIAGEMNSKQDKKQALTANEPYIVPLDVCQIQINECFHYQGRVKAR